MASRAQLLAGLRTGGPGSPRMDSGDAHFYQQQGQHSPTQLKASAAPFTPGSGYEALEQHQHHQQLHREKSLEEHMASLQLQQQGGAHLTQQQLAAAQLHNILRQRQQQQQTQGQAHAQHQMDLLRQQQQQAAVAQHQRALLGQIQAEYDRQAQVNALREQMELQQAQQSQQQAYSAAEQRQAAQASIQASLRTRQAQQLYAQMLQQQQLAGAYGQEEVNAEALQQFQQAQLVQRMHAIQQLQAVAQQQQFALAAQQYAAQTGGAPAEQSPYGSNDSGSRRVSNNSPQLNGGQSRRSPTLNELTENKRSVSSADQASSWRSRTATNGSTSKSSTTTVVDDSASEKSIEMPMSRNSSNTGFAGGVDTPDTSEDDVGADKQQQQQPAKMAPLHVRKQGAATAAPAAKQALPSMPAPRPINISAAPRSRNFTAEAKAAMSASGPVLSNQPTRQPRGPPTDFKPVNFQSRISARTRREAMSRLCASPRVASFAGGLVGAQQSAAEPSQGPGGALGFSALGVPAKLQSVA